MTESIHSPGPWRAVKPRSLWRIKDANNHFVMESAFCNVRRQQDAFLIAAAPEMLESLGEAIKSLEWAHDQLGLSMQDDQGRPLTDEYGELRATLDDARAAIQRALGNHRE